MYIVQRLSTGVIQLQKTYLSNSRVFTTDEHS